MKNVGRLISIGTMLAMGVVAVPLASCTQVTGTEDVSRDNEALSRSAESASGHDQVRKVFERALEEVQLRPEQQREVDKLREEREERYQAVKAAKRDLWLAVADQIEKGGNIDRCALAPQIAVVASAFAKAHPADRAAFEKLHAILDADQREKFVGALHRSWEEHKKMHSPSALVDKMDRELGLTDEQKDSALRIVFALDEIRRAEPSYRKHHERWRKILHAFKSDEFVLDQIAPMENAEAKAKKKLTRHLWAAEALLPVLAQEQRSTLAQKIREKAKSHGEGMESSSGQSATD